MLGFRISLINPRYSIPTVESFKGPVAEDDFDLSMANNDEEKQQATNARASKVWRILRIASKTKLNLFDKIDDGGNIDALFKPPEAGGDEPGTEPSAEETARVCPETIASSMVETTTNRLEPDIPIVKETVVK